MAQVIDLTIVWFFTISLTMISGPFMPAAIGLGWVYALLFLAYGITLDYFRYGTVGKLMMGLRVVCKTSIRPRFVTMAYRNVLKATFLLLLIDCFLLLIGQQGLHNRLVSCEVVHDTM